MAFLAENMVTKQELDERLQTLATKQDFHDLLTSVDGIAKRFKDTDEELPVVAGWTSRMEEWSQKAANKIGVEYKALIYIRRKEQAFLPALPRS